MLMNAEKNAKHRLHDDDDYSWKISNIFHEKKNIFRTKWSFLCRVEHDD